jgi:hypothetical protein
VVVASRVAELVYSASLNALPVPVVVVREIVDAL